MGPPGGMVGGEESDNHERRSQLLGLLQLLTRSSISFQGSLRASFLILLMSSRGWSLGKLCLF